MSGRLGIDFGSSNSLAAVWDPARGRAVPLDLPDFALPRRQGGETIPLIPSLIHYAPERRWIGGQVAQHGLVSAPGTFRWMKRYIQQRSPRVVRVDGQDITPAQAGTDFLRALLRYASDSLGLDGDEEVAFTVPVESFEHYANWLTQTAAAAGLRRYRLLDEPSAAALGYRDRLDRPLAPGDGVLVFDFGGGTLDVAVVLMEAAETVASSSHTGRRSRLLGKAGAEVGGASLDGWLFAETLRRNGRRDSDEAVRAVSGALLTACEAVKEQLSSADTAALQVGDLTAQFSAAEFEALCEDHDLFGQIDRTLRRALIGAAEHGYDEERLRAVLMVGGSSQIPAVQRALRRSFGPERVRLERPLDAIACGAATFIAGVDFYDFIQHDYALRYVDAAAGEYAYRPLVARGTPYPSREPVARLTIQATHAHQTQLGLAIFELGRIEAGTPTARVELVFDPSGAARLTTVSPEQLSERARFWLNEANPTFLHADPPAQPGETRFELLFSLDENKRLRLTARDLLNGVEVLREAAVAQLV